MTFDWNIRITDIAIMLATFLGPILAVYASEKRREWNDARSRKVQIFRTLMATRAATLNPSHIESLNLVEVEFIIQMPKSGRS